MEIYCWIVVVIITIYLIKSITKGVAYKGDERLDGKVIIITGANSGIGFEVALEIARRGANVILACRDKKRGLTAESKIKHETSNQNVRFRQLDLASFNSIRTFVELLKKEEKSLYALVNNAGIFWVPFETTVDGFELNFGVNHLGHFLLTILLLPLLTSSMEKSKVVSVGSVMYMFGKLNLTDINCTSRIYNFVKAYCDSKLANLLMVKELAQRLKNQNCQTYCADPGIVFTNIGSSFFMRSFLYRYILYPIVWLLMKSPNDGAQTIIHCLCSNNVKRHTGKLYSECEQVNPWASALDKKISKDLWDESIRLSNISIEELTPFIKMYS